MTTVLRTLAGGWHLEVVPVAAALTAGWLYLRGLRALSSAAGRRPARPQVGAFGAGVATILVALLSPLDDLATQLQWAHMTQHLLLLLVAPPLVLLGRPLTTAWHGIPPAARNRLRRLLPGRAHAGGTGLGLLAVCLIFTATMWVWHLPRLYDATLTNQPVHDLEHTTFLVAGLVFWAPIVRGALWRHSASHVARASACLSGLVTSWMLAVYIGYSPRVLYSYSGDYGVSPLADQQMASGVMWIPGSVPFLIGLTVLLVGWFEADDRAGLAEAARRPGALG